MIRVDEHRSSFGTITIFRRRSTGSLVYKQGGCCQSEADRNGVSLASYIHSIFGLILQTRARKVLLIGCGGGTLGTMLARKNLAVTAVDVNPAAFEFARLYFDLPDDVGCKVADGYEFLLSDGGSYDAIVLDAYQGDQIPVHLQSLDFFKLIRSHLTRCGLVLANIHVMHNHDDSVHKIANRMASLWSDVRLLDSPGWLNRNVIAMAGRVSALTKPALLEVPDVDADEISEELETMEFCDWRIISE